MFLGLCNSIAAAAPSHVTAWGGVFFASKALTSRTASRGALRARKEKIMTIIQRYNALTVEYIRAAKRRGLSWQTISNYSHRLNSFGAFLEKRYADDGAAREYVDFDDITAYADDLANRGVKNSTVKQLLVELGQFFTYATKPYIPDSLRYDHSPVSKDFYPKVKDEQVDEILPDYAISKLWVNRCLYHRGTQYFPRNYAIVTLILSTGLRNKEVLDLTLADIDFQHKEITVRHGKGDKFRVVDAPEIALTAILLYLHAAIRPVALSDTAPLFGTTAAQESGNPTTRSGAADWHRGTTGWLSGIVERHVFNQTGFSSVRSHDLRHLFARVSLNATGNLAELQGALGHTSPIVTERYSGRLMARRRRESAQAILAARDEAAEQNRKLLESLESSSEQQRIKGA